MCAKYRLIATLLLSAMMAVAAPTPLKRPAKRTSSIDSPLDLSSKKDQGYNILYPLPRMKDKSQVIPSCKHDADGKAYYDHFPHARHSRPCPASTFIYMTQTVTSEMPLPEESVSPVNYGELAGRGHWWGTEGVLHRAAGVGELVQKSVETGRKLVKAVKAPVKVPKRPKAVVVLGEDMLGRRIVRRGIEVFIEEPHVQGTQWQGAEELDDETDEPYWDEA